MDVCETLLLDVVAPEAYQNGCSYIHELSGPKFDSLCINLAWLAVTQRTSKKKTRTCARESGSRHQSVIAQKQIGYYNNSGEVVETVWHSSHVNSAIYVEYLVGS